MQEIDLDDHGLTRDRRRDRPPRRFGDPPAFCGDAGRRLREVYRDAGRSTRATIAAELGQVAATMPEVAG